MKISTKLILLLVTAVVSVMGGYALITVSNTRERLDDEMRKMADHIGLALSVGALHHLEDGDVQGVFNVLETISKNEDVVGAAVFGNDGHLVAASRSLSDEVKDEKQIYIHTQGIYGHEGSKENLRYTYICGIEDASGGMIGSLKLVLRERSMLPYVLAVRNQVLAAILILTVVLSLLVIYVSKRQIADPMAVLADGVLAIGRGELDRRINFANGGEWAFLAEAFNRMAVNLRASNQKLVAEREHIQSIVDSIPEGVLVFDDAGKITAWNQAMSRTFGLLLEDVLGKGIKEVLVGVPTRDFWRMVDCLRNKEMEKCEVRELHINTATERIFSAAGSPLWVTNGSDGAVVVLIDVTDRVRLERQIQQSEKLAAVGQLAAGVAHEIGTPLNVISGSAEYLLMDTREEDAAAEELKTIVAEVERISDLVKRLMTFARHEESKIEPVDLRSLAESVLILLRRQMEKQGIEIQAELPDDLPEIAGDRDQMQQVLLNLIMNAWQAMPNGGRITLCGSVESRVFGDDSEAKTCVKLSLSDTGCGIPETHIRKIFEPFFTTKDVGEGTGLGLAIVHRIIEDHGGHIAVLSREGEGSTFEIYLPVNEGGVLNHG